jgi:hypothetical protein
VRVIPELPEFKKDADSWATASQISLFGSEWPIVVSVAAPYEGGEGPFAESVTALSDFWENRGTALRLALNEIFAFYLRIAPIYRANRTPEQGSVFAPVVSVPEELTKVIAPEELWVPEQEGTSQIVVMLFSCLWDPEQGVGVRFTDCIPDIAGEQALVL